MTNEPLKKTPLSVRMADRLQADILAGIWTGVLPGYRVLAERYGTSFRTALAALKTLEQRKVLEPATQGNRRGVKKCGPVKAKAGDASLGTLLLLYASDFPISAQTWSMLLKVRDCWNRNGGRVAMVEVNYRRYSQPTPILRTLIESHGANALLVDTAPVAWVEAAAKSQLPLYLSGGEWHTVKDESVSGVGFYFPPQFERVLSDLRSLGHQRILAPMEPHLPVLRNELVAVTRRVLGAEFRTHLVDQMFPIFEESVPDVWFDYWDRAFSRTHPTAVVLRNDSHLLSLYGYCAERGIRIPRDVSVVHVGYSEKLEWCRPVPCQMRPPAEKLIAHFQRWIRGGLQPIGKKAVTLEKIPGASVAKPRQTKSR